MPRDKRIEAVDRDEGTKIVLLKAGWAYEMHNTPQAGHSFSADSAKDLREGMKLVAPCSCPDCVQALKVGGSLWR